jgi:hypothetical protein
MKQIIALTFFFICYSGFSQKQIFESPNLKSIIKDHKTVAILPFTVKLTYKKLPKNYDEETNKQQENKMSQSIQSSMYTFMLRKHDNYSVDFQDVEKTNVLLKKAQILDKLDSLTKDEIAKILGVDGVISGVYESENTKSEAGAIASAIVFGGLGGKTASSNLTITVNNGVDGELLWRYHRSLDKGLSDSTDDLVDYMMKQIARNFPYKN